LGGNHPWWVTTYPIGDPYDRSDLMRDYNPKNLHTVIGSDVWIGYGATLLGGVQIGDGAVIGARAVVASSVPPYAVVVGNPARIVRYRFEPSEVDVLLRIRWWEWNDEQVKRALPLLASEDVRPFVAKYGAST